MLIDWFTVAAQILNFLILVWLLKRFLYKPVLKAIDAREKRIAAELAEAATQMSVAQEQRAEFQSKNKSFDEQRSALLAEATEAAKVAREHLLAEAHREADSLRMQLIKTTRNDQISMGQEISSAAAREVFGIARKALSDLAAADLEERMGHVFTRRLREMDSKGKELLGFALKSASAPAVLRSAFEMPATVRATIQNALNETFSAQIRVQFETSPEAVSGIELSAGGQKVAWSIAAYLAAFEEKLGSLLDGQAGAAAPQVLAAATAPINDMA